MSNSENTADFEKNGELTDNSAALQRKTDKCCGGCSCKISSAKNTKVAEDTNSTNQSDFESLPDTLKNKFK